MASAYDVADFFVELANQDDEGEMTNLKLNKLLYYAQGHFLARTGSPLFEDSIEAWDAGPVVPSIYHKYKVCGNNHIAGEGLDISEHFTEEELDLLLDVAREYYKYTAAYLVNKTHKPGTPWSQTKRNEAISHSSIISYFTDCERLTPFSEILAKKNIPVIGIRGSDGILVLPSSENDVYWDKYGEPVTTVAI